MSTKPPETSYCLGCFRVSREHKPLRLPHQDTLQSPCPPYYMSGSWGYCRIQAGLSKNVRLAFHDYQHMRDQETARKGFITRERIWVHGLRLEGRESLGTAMYALLSAPLKHHEWARAQDAPLQPCESLLHCNRTWWPTWQAENPDSLTPIHKQNTPVSTKEYRKKSKLPPPPFHTHLGVSFVLFFFNNVW